MKNSSVQRDLKLFFVCCSPLLLYKLNWHVWRRGVQIGIDLQLPVSGPYVHFKREKTVSIITSGFLLASR